MHDLTSPKWRGCIQCGYIYGPAHILEEPPKMCPDCGDALTMGLTIDVFGAEGALKLQKKYCKEHGIKRNWKDPKHPRIKEPPKPKEPERQVAEEIFYNQTGNYQVALLEDKWFLDNVINRNYGQFRFPTKLVAYLALGTIINLISNGAYDLARKIAREADLKGYLIMETMADKSDPVKVCPNCGHPDSELYAMTRTMNDPREDPVRCLRCQTIYYIGR